MIKLKTNNKLVRQTTADYEYTDADGVNHIEQIRVRYYSLPISELREQRLKLETIAREDPGRIIWLSDTLPDVLESLPDILDEKGKPIAITKENLDLIARNNLEAINKAIIDDLAPKDQPGK